MLSKIIFKYEDGKDLYDDIAFYAVSDCDLCTDVIDLLKKNSIRFRYIYTDHLNEGIGEVLKSGLEQRSGGNVDFPCIVIDEKEIVSDFKSGEWKKKFSLA